MLCSNQNLFLILLIVSVCLTTLQMRIDAFNCQQILTNIFSLSFVQRCCNDFHQRLKATNTMRPFNMKFYTGKIKWTRSFCNSTLKQTRNRYSSNFADYFCRIHIFSGALLKYVLKHLWSFINFINMI